MSKREVFKKKVVERRERRYANIGNDENRFRKEDLVESREMGTRTGAEVLVCGDKVGEEDAFAFTDEPWLTNGSGEKCKRSGKK